MHNLPNHDLFTQIVKSSVHDAGLGGVNGLYLVFP